MFKLGINDWQAQLALFKVTLTTILFLISSMKFKYAYIYTMVKKQLNSIEEKKKYALLHKINFKMMLFLKLEINPIIYDPR